MGLQLTQPRVNTRHDRCSTERSNACLESLACRCTSCAANKQPCRLTCLKETLGQAGSRGNRVMDTCPHCIHCCVEAGKALANGVLRLYSRHALPQGMLVSSLSTSDHCNVRTGRGSQEVRE